jgi:hypothetical protein
MIWNALKAVLAVTVIGLPFIAIVNELEKEMK